MKKKKEGKTNVTHITFNQENKDNLIIDFSSVVEKMTQSSVKALYSCIRKKENRDVEKKQATTTQKTKN